MGILTALLIQFLIYKKWGLLIPRKSVVATIDNLQEELDLVDIWRIKNPAKRSFTWSQNSPMIFCRLDYGWLISNALHDLVVTTDIIPAIKSDHAAISIQFSNRSNDNDDEDYIDDIAEKIPVWLAEGRNELSDNRNIWDWMKYNIRAHAIQYSKRRARERNEREKSLEENYAKAKLIFEVDPNDLNASILNSAKDLLELFYEEKMKGIIIRARARWYEHGEKSTKYFLNLEKRNHIKKHMRKLNINGSITTGPFNILSEQRRFYQELYTSRSKNEDNSQMINSFLKDLNIPKLSEKQKVSCEGKITSEECALLLVFFFKQQITWE